ncbi:MAG: hypothetical protein LBU28_00265 [Spirochaetaceae bacterium]|jgi:hypothetical protein|nr:hypothetical protein [Spirochaetaceae bacterium]
MAIQPIDLQTLFTQLDKVGKHQAAQKEGVQIQQALQGDLIQRKTDERIRSVNESQDMGEGTEAVNDRSPRQHPGREKQDRQENAGDPADEAFRGEDPFRDPDLGKNVDLSG